MKDVKLWLRYLAENKMALAALVLGALAGAYAGAMAYYHGWLG